MDLEKELELAISLAFEAGETALKIHDQNYEYKEKDNNAGPVTEADRIINDFLVQSIAKVFPDDLIFAEESLNQPTLKSERTWWIDPIDGTKDFIKKNGEWAIMIGLSIHGKSVLGIVYQAQSKKMFYAKSGSGAFLRHQEKTSRLQVNSPQPIQNAVVVKSRTHPDRQADQIVEAMGITRSIIHGSVGLKLSLIATGKADLYLNFSGKCHYWDICAPDAILSEAGGIIQHLDHQPLLYENRIGTKISAPFIAGCKHIVTPVSNHYKINGY